MKLVASSCAQPDIYLMVIENKFVVALRATTGKIRIDEKKSRPGKSMFGSQCQKMKN
jgi:hypothetical protein